MRIKTLLVPNKFSFWIAFFWTTLILVLSFKSPSNFPKIEISNIDKVVHFMFYFVFVVLWYRFLIGINKCKTKQILLLLCISIALGVSIEFAQGYFTSTRQADYIDAIANTLGSLFGVLVATLFYKQENN